METATKPTTILTIGAEGFMMDVLGQEHDGRWHFRTTQDATTFAEFDPTLAGLGLYEVSAWMDRWEDVLALLDRQQYWQLSPIFVHPRFANAIRMAIASRRLKRSERERWKSAIADGQREISGRPLESPAAELTVDVSRCQLPERRIVLDHAAFPNLQSLLDLLYSSYLHRVAASRSYGTQWILVNDRNMLRVSKSSNPDGRSLGASDILAADRLTVVLL